MVEKPNEFGKLSLIELSDFETVNQIELPKDYKDFQLTYNGGKPIKNINPQPQTIVKYILGIHNGPYYASLYKHIDMFTHRIPFSTLPVACDGFGNLFLMSLHPESFGQIYFWDHEGEPEVQDGHYTGNCRFTAHSFTGFLEEMEGTQ
ncbi:MAG: SMI1/KNR4 family protein [Bacteroidota bacterium]